jgi:hypothetical protein
MEKINEYEETRKRKERENLPPHLQFPELSYEEMQKKHIELVSSIFHFFFLTIS